MMTTPQLTRSPLPLARHPTVALQLWQGRTADDGEAEREPGHMGVGGGSRKGRGEEETSLQWRVSCGSLKGSARTLKGEATAMDAGYVGFVLFLLAFLCLPIALI